MLGFFFSVMSVLCVNLVTANMLLSVFFLSGELFVHSLLFGDIDYLQFGRHSEINQKEQTELLCPVVHALTAK